MSALNTVQIYKEQGNRLESLENEIQKRNTDAKKQMEVIESRMREQLKTQGEGLIQLAEMLSCEQDQRSREKDAMEERMNDMMTNIREGFGLVLQRTGETWKGESNETNTIGPTTPTTRCPPSDKRMDV